MDFTLSPDAVAYRDLVRRIIADTVTDEAIDEIHRTGTFDLPALNFALAKHGLLERAVPGMGKGDPIELWILFNELEKAGAPYDGIAVSLMIAGVVNAVGTEEQKERIIPSIVSGEAGVCMGYSEPDYGSDVASIVTRAVRDGDSWIINGAKMWTTMAHVAKWLILLTRTDLDLPKHRGLTMFILPMDTPGITVKPVHTMASEHTNATWYDDVTVGDEAVLGEVNGGWRTMTVTRRDGWHQSRRAATHALHQMGTAGRPRRRPSGEGGDGEGSHRHARFHAADTARGVDRSKWWATWSRRFDGEVVRHRGVPARGSCTSTCRGTTRVARLSRRRCGSRRIHRLRRAPLARDHHLRWYERDSAQQHRRASPRPAAQPLALASAQDNCPATENHERQQCSYCDVQRGRV
ncbi:MAG: hypothetical protein RLZ84_1468 [Actinomycetota bacterium]